MISFSGLLRPSDAALCIAIVACFGTKSHGSCCGEAALPERSARLAEGEKDGLIPVSFSLYQGLEVGWRKLAVEVLTLSSQPVGRATCPQVDSKPGVVPCAGLFLFRVG